MAPDTAGHHWSPVEVAGHRSFTVRAYNSEDGENPQITEDSSLVPTTLHLVEGLGQIVSAKGVRDRHTSRSVSASVTRTGRFLLALSVDATYEKGRWQEYYYS